SHHHRHITDLRCELPVDQIWLGLQSEYTQDKIGQISQGSHSNHLDCSQCPDVANSSKCACRCDMACPGDSSREHQDVAPIYPNSIAGKTQERKSDDGNRKPDQMIPRRFRLKKKKRKHRRENQIKSGDEARLRRLRKIQSQDIETNPCETTQSQQDSTHDLALVALP